MDSPTSSRKREWHVDFGLHESQLVSLEMKDADFDSVLTWIETILRVRLPHIETESPSKRSRSPGREIARRVYQLFQTDRQSLEEALRDLQLRSPTKDSEIESTLEWLLARLKSSLRSWQMKNAPYLLTDRLSTFKSDSSAKAGLMLSPAEPSSPTLSNKRALMASQRRVTYPDLPSALNDIDYNVTRPVKSSAKRSASNIFGIPLPSGCSTLGPRNLDGTLLQPNSNVSPFEMTAPIASRSHVEVTNISFNTTGTESANTSFWSEPSDPHQPNSSATTVASSMCLDGVGEKEIEPPSTFGGSLQLADSQWEKLEQHPTSSYDYGEPFSQVPTQSHVSDGGSGITSVTSHLQSEPARLNHDGADMCPHRVSDLLLKDHSTVEQHNEKDDDTESPAMRNRKCRKIVEDGLMHTPLPAFSDALPFNVKWECLRLIQMRKITCHQLEHDWHEPRSIDSLYTLAGFPEREKVAGFNADSQEFSLGAKLVPSKSKDDSILEIRLDRPVRQRQNELERTYGANRVMVIEFTPAKTSQISEYDMIETISDMFRREDIDGELLFLGREWVEFYTRPKKRRDKKTKATTYEFHLFAVSGYDIPNVSIWTFCDGLLHFAENADQLSGKLYSRLDMLASRTDQTAQFHRDEIELIDDLKATNEQEDRFDDLARPSDRRFDKEDEEVIMTDGCGKISAYAMRQICTTLGWPKEARLPSAVQGRFAGAKGIWLLDDAEQTFIRGVGHRPTKLISVRKSQVKIRQKASVTNFTFNFLRFSSPPKPSVLYPGFLPILQNRSGPDADRRILSFVRSKVRELTDSLDSALENPQELRFWMNEQNAISKTAERHLGIDTAAGFPTFRAEKIIQMLESGFVPKKNTYLADEVQSAVNAMFTLERKNFKIPCPQSTMLIGVPDPTGTLLPGEVYVNFSQPFHDCSTGRSDWTWAGRDCLVARNPARRISDIQKLRIVQVPELAARGISDVVVFSVRGRQPEANKLQGGDYDGDTFWVCIEPELVDTFHNAPAPRTSPDPAELCIKKDMTTFGDVVAFHGIDDVSARDGGLLRFLARHRKIRMQPTLLGSATLLQERIAYHDGIDSLAANMLNALCDLIIDQDKQCYGFDYKAFLEFCKKYGISRGYNRYPEPAHRKHTSIDADNSDNEGKEFSRPMKDSIVDQVYFSILEPDIKAARERIKEALIGCSVKDEQLVDCFHKKLAGVRIGSVAMEVLQNLLREIIIIREQGGGIKSALKMEYAGGIRQIQACRDNFEKIMPSDGVRSDPVIQQWLEPIVPGAQPPWAYIKASALAKRCDYTGVHHIPYLIAGRELCYIKAMASGSIRTLTETSYLHLKPLKKRTLAMTRGTAEIQTAEDESEEMDDTFVSAAEELEWQQIDRVEADGIDGDGFVNAREQTNGGR